MGGVGRARKPSADTIGRVFASLSAEETRQILSAVLHDYHRVVVAQWIGVTPPAILDIERIGPGEGELTAARRLLERILRQHSRLIDVSRPMPCTSTPRSSKGCSTRASTS
jgi:hypothetical protein